MIEVELLDHMGSDLTVVNAARVSMGAQSFEMSERDVGLVKFLSEESHVTPFRHPVVQLRCKAPLFLARQLGKHQVGFSWNEVSRRYKDGDSIPIEFYVPEVINGRPSNLMKDVPVPMDCTKSAIAAQAIKNAYRHSLSIYEMLLGYGVAPEHARMVLPQGMLTEWVWTGSLYGWFGLWKQRSGEHAQSDAVVFAAKIDKIMSELYPICWKALTGKE